MEEQRGRAVAQHVRRQLQRRLGWEQPLRQLGLRVKVAAFVSFGSGASGMLWGRSFRFVGLASYLPEVSMSLKSNRPRQLCIPTLQEGRRRDY